MPDSADGALGRMPRPMPVSGGSEPEVLNLGRLVQTVLRHLPVVAVVTTLFAIGGALSAVSQPKTFTATTVLMLEPYQREVVDSQRSAAGPPDASMIASQIETLSSRTLAGRLIDRLGLMKSQEWNPTKQSFDPAAQVKGFVKTMLGQGSAGGITSPALAREAAIDRVLQAEFVRRRQMSYALNVGFTTQSAAGAALMANTLAELYLEDQIESRGDQVRRASAWLSDRLTALRGEVAAKEAAAETYRAQGGLLSADGSTLTETSIREVQSAVLTARADLAEKTARYNQVKRLLAEGGSPETIGEAISSDTIRQLRAQQTEITRRKGEIEQRYGPLHPERRKAALEEKNIETQIKLELDRIMASLQNEVQVSQSRLQTLMASLGAVQSELTQNNASLVRLRELERDAAAARNVYESYLKRSQEMSDQETLKSVDARILSAAAAPGGPSGPRVLLITSLWLLVGLVVSGVIAFLWELIDPRINDAGDVEEALGIPAISSIPRIRGRKDNNPADLLLSQPRSPYAEAFRVLETVIRDQADGRSGFVIAVSSALPGDGKTAVSLSLARLAAANGQRVLLMDCDARRQGLLRATAIAPEVGFDDVLDGAADWRTALTPDSGSNVQMLLTKVRADNEDRLELGAIDTVLSAVRGHFDLIVLDCPPVLAVAEARTLCRSADATVFVVSVGESSRRAVHNAVMQLRNNGVALLGIVLNKVNPLMQSWAAHSLYYRAVSDYYGEPRKRSDLAAAKKRIGQALAREQKARVKG